MTNEEKWALLRQDADHLKRLVRPTLDMQAYALRRRGYLFDDIDHWDIDRERVCPGSTSWAKKYRGAYATHRAAFEASPRVRSEMVSVAFTLGQSAADWEHVRRVAFMPPESVPKKLRKSLANMPFHQARLALDRLSVQHWGSAVRYPEVDYPATPNRSR